MTDGVPDYFAAEAYEDPFSAAEVAQMVYGDEEPEPDRMATGAAFIFDPDLDVDPVWGTPEQALWASGESTMITASPGVGKTTVAQRVVLAMVGIGGHVLGYKVRPARRVLYLAMDRPKQIARSFRRMVTEHDRDTLERKLVVWKGPPPADIARIPGTLLSLVRAADADVVVIDSLKDAALGLSSDDVGSAVNRAIQEVLVHRVEVLILHHQIKRGGDGKSRPTTLADVYGSTWITSGAGSVVLLDGDAGSETATLHHLKQPAEPIGPLKLEFDRFEGRVRIAEQFDPLEWLRSQHGRVTAAGMAITRTGEERPPKEVVEQCRRDLKRLTRSGLAREFEGSRGGPGGGTPTTWEAVREGDLMAA